MSFLIRITVLARVNDTSGKVCSRSLGLVSSRIKFDKIVIVLLPRTKNRQEKPAVISTLFATLKRWSSFHHSVSREIRRRGKTRYTETREILHIRTRGCTDCPAKKKRTTRPLRRDRSTIMHNVTRRVVNITVNGNGSVILRAETHGQNHRCQLTSRYFSALHFSRRTKNPSLGHSRERYVA